MHPPQLSKERVRDIYMYIKGGWGGVKTISIHMYIITQYNTVFTHAHILSLQVHTLTVSVQMPAYSCLYTHSVHKVNTVLTIQLCSHINTFSHSALMQHFSVTILHAAQDSPPPPPPPPILHKHSPLHHLCLFIS